MKKLFFILLIFSGFISKAQHQHERETHKFHVGIGLNASGNLQEAGIYPGIHFHILKSIGDSEKWQFGLGYENIISGEPHHTINIPVGYSFLNGFSVKAGPGLTFAKHHDKSEILLSAHMEALYEFEFNHFHLGPIVGLGIDKENQHVGAGIHMGLGF